MLPGQYYDSETGLHYNYVRTYDPSTGRYLESDPMGLRADINTYTYVGGNPIKYVDIYGLYKLCEWVPQSITFVENNNIPQRPIGDEYEIVLR